MRLSVPVIIGFKNIDPNQAETSPEERVTCVDNKTDFEQGASALLKVNAISKTRK